MIFASPKLLLVCNASDAADVFQALDEAGLGQPAMGLGGDETLDIFEQSEPDVVILVAGLNQGDVPSLVSAIRSGRHGRPAPIVLIASADASVAEPGDARDIDFDQFVTRPIRSRALADAVLASSRAATGARINAAMDLAIESFVADAMDLLAPPASVAGSGDEPAPNEPEPTSSEAAPSFAEDTQASTKSREATQVLQPKKREPTAVLPSKTREPTQVLPSQERELLALPPDEEKENRPQLDRASRELLEEVLPNETLDVDIDELDRVERAGEPTSADQDAEPAAGDFARQLRQKMSAMAERLFPGQSSEEKTANITPPNAAHTEIDLREIVEEPVEPATEDGSHSMAASTHALVSDSDITMARSSLPGSRPGGQSLVGQIDAHVNDIAAVLARFWKSEFSGSVVLRREEEEKRIQFDAGRVVFASSGRSDDRMGELLLREGKISVAQLQDCHEQVAATGRRMGEVLVDMGYLKPRELLPAVRQHLEDLLYSVFAWTQGSYDAMPEQSIDERIRLSRHPAALIVEGIRRKYDIARLEAALGGLGAIVVASAGDTLSSVIGATDLSEKENRAQALFDGEHSLDDIAKECKLDRLRVAQLAYAWVCLGVAEVAEGRGDEAAERKAPATHYVGETDLEIDRKRVLAKHLLVKEADYFQLLGVRADASAFEIRRAYEAAQRYFTIESFPLELQEELATVLQEITEVIDEAFLVLSDDHIRSSYRANLR